MAKVNPIQLQKHLKGVDYPVSKQDLIAHAKKQGADEKAISALEQMPDKQYETPTNVSKAISDSEQLLSLMGFQSVSGRFLEPGY